LPLNPTQLAKAPAEGIHPSYGRFTRLQKADPRNGLGLLPLGGERRGEGPGQRSQQEAAAVHAGTIGRLNR
jgi:hypothetical protein